MNETIKLDRPTFRPGQVIDLTYKTEGSMPNRIMIKTVFRREQDTEWQYDVMLESTGKSTVMNQSFIGERKSKHVAPVWSTPTVMERCRLGWRFCGNHSIAHAAAESRRIANNMNVDGVMIWPALDVNGRLIPGEHGIWIKYVHIINDNGMMSASNDGGIRVK